MALNLNTEVENQSGNSPAKTKTQNRKYTTMNNSNTKANSNLFSDQENSVRDQIFGALEVIETSKRASAVEEEQALANSMRHELSEALNLDLDGVSQSIIDSLAPSLANWNQVRSNPLGLQDLRQRVLKDIEDAQDQINQRQSVNYQLVRCIRKDKTVTASRITSDNPVSKLPTATVYRDFSVELMQFSKVEISNPVDGFKSEAEALSTLQTPVSDAFVFERETVKRGSQAMSRVDFWKGFNIVSFSAPQGYIVVSLQNKKRIKKMITISLAEINNANVSAFGHVAIEEGDKVMYLDMILSSPSDAKAAIAHKGTKWVASFDKVLP
jgi:hypothetical protein